MASRLQTCAPSPAQDLDELELMVRESWKVTPPLQPSLQQSPQRRQSSTPQMPNP